MLAVGLPSTPKVGKLAVAYENPLKTQGFRKPNFDDIAFQANAAWMMIKISAVRNASRRTALSPQNRKASRRVQNTPHMRPRAKTLTECVCGPKPSQNARRPAQFQV